MFKKVAQSGGYVRAICVTGQADFTRSTIENLTEKAMGYGAKGMAWIAYKQNGEIYSILTKYFTEDEMKELIDFILGLIGGGIIGLWIIVFILIAINCIKNFFKRKIQEEVNRTLAKKKYEEYLAKKESEIL